MYGSRLEELRARDGAYNHEKAALDWARHIEGEKTDNMQELTYADRKRIHNLKYYTWVEQQGKTYDEINDLWYGHVFEDVHTQTAQIDELILAFNEEAAK